MSIKDNSIIEKLPLVKFITRYRVLLELETKFVPRVGEIITIESEPYNVEHVSWEIINECWFVTVDVIDVIKDIKVNRNYKGE